MRWGEIRWDEMRLDACIYTYSTKKTVFVYEKQWTIYKPLLPRIFLHTISTNKIMEPPRPRNWKKIWRSAARRGKWYGNFLPTIDWWLEPFEKKTLDFTIYGCVLSFFPSLATKLSYTFGLTFASESVSLGSIFNCWKPTFQEFSGRAWADREVEEILQEGKLPHLLGWIRWSVYPCLWWLLDDWVSEGWTTPDWVLFLRMTNPVENTRVGVGSSETEKCNDGSAGQRVIANA